VADYGTVPEAEAHTLYRGMEEVGIAQDKVEEGKERNKVLEGT
jgi:hypothetical protein